MCNRPITQKNEYGATVTFACRTCDDCIAARKNDWVARGMAELATSEFACVLNLTYRNHPDGTLPRSARAFNYIDVQRFFKILRKRAKKLYGDEFELRYLVAGERGSQKDRVHWHMILFASHDLYALGEWTTFVGEPLDGPRPPYNSASGKRKLPMDHFDAWPHGHVTTDSADQASLSYTLKYALKDQFNVVKSAGTARIAKAENHGAGMFRMSKKPPIGWRYLAAKIDRLRDRFAVPPTVQVAIPRYSGYWWPKGPIREWYLDALRGINETHNETHGRDCPQWEALLASVSQSETDMEKLNEPLETYTTEQQEEFLEDFREHLATQQKSIARQSAYSDHRRTCGKTSVCAGCEAGFAEQTQKEYADWQALQRRQFLAYPVPEGRQVWTIDDWFKLQNRVNPFCVYADSRDKAFSLSGRLG